MSQIKAILLDMGGTLVYSAERGVGKREEFLE